MASTVFEDKLTKQSLIDLLHPIGSIYMTTETSDPSTLFSGTTWEQINDEFLVASGTNFEAGVPGGNRNRYFTPEGSVGEFTITENEMPSHSHDLGSHTHNTATYTLQNSSAHTHPWVGFYAPNVSGYTAFLARDADSGSLSGNLILDSGAHTHTVSGSSGTAYIGSSDISQDMVNTSSVGLGTSHSHSFAGSGMMIQTLPPYLSVNIWKRVA